MSGNIEKERTLVDLSYYAMKNILNYNTITEIPQENIEYLSSSLLANRCNGMFINCAKLTSIPWNDFDIDTSQCTSMASMFSSCVSLTSLDLSSMDTSNVTSMRYMFLGCRSLTSLDLSNFDTSKVKYMDYVFNSCRNLRQIITPNGFDLSSCITIDYMFTYCTSYNGTPLHFKNVKRSLDFSKIGGTEGKHYVIDSYLD